MLLGLDLPLPKRFFVHGFLTIDGQKMSKTIGNVVDPVEVSQKFGLDVLRYFLFREVPFGKDGDFSLQRLAEIYKSDLMDGLGNLVSRTLALAERYYEKKVPEVDIVKTGYKIRLSSGKSYEGFRNCFKVWWDYIKSEYMELKLEKILAVIFGFTMDKENRGGIVPTYNSLINDSKLWELVEKDQSLAGEILYDILEGFRQIALMIAPFMPETSDKILKKLGLESVEKQLQSAKNFKDLIKWGILKSGSKIDKGEALFPRR
jgi:methionyl-tRNA synthetase